MSDPIEDIRLCAEDAKRGNFVESLDDLRSDREELLRWIDRLRARIAELEAALRSLQVAAAEALSLVPDETSQTHAFLSAIHRHVASALAKSTSEPVNEKQPAPPKEVT